MGFNEAKLRASIRNVLARVRAISTLILFQNHEAFKEVGPKFRLTSCLSDGSSQFVAEEALRMSFELQSPLPFLRDAYREQLPTESSKRTFDRLLGKAKRIMELDDSLATIDLATEAVSRVVLRQSDALIAIWNGKPPKSRGETGQMVREALQRKIPVIWIVPSDSHSIFILDQISETGEAKIFRCFDKAPEASEPDTVARIASIDDRLREALSLPSTTDLRALKRFQRERQRYWHCPIVYRVFQASFAWPGLIYFGIRNKIRSSGVNASGKDQAIPDPTADGKPRLLTIRDRLIKAIPISRVSDFEETDSKDSKDSEDRLWESVPGAEKNVETPIQKLFNWTDGIAKIYADRHRGAFIITYLIGALAVLAAFLGSYAGNLPQELVWFRHHRAWFAVELALISATLILALVGMLGHWHDRWIDYRLLAEDLRQMRVLGLFARVAPSFELPAHLREDSQGSAWFNWYFRAVVRTKGLIHARIDQGYLDICCKILRKEIEGQVKYHYGNEKKLEALHWSLHGISIGLFLLTFFACLFHLREVGGKSAEGILTFFAIVSPAFGAAIQGILHQAEFGRIAHRSHAIKNQLEALVARIPLQGEEMSFHDLGAAAESFCETQSLEQADWRSVFIRKEVPLP